MKQNVGLSAFIVAAVMFAIRSGLPGPQAGQPVRTQNGTSQTGSNQGTPPADILEGPWLATRSFFHATNDPEPPALLGDPIDSIRNCVKPPGACSKPLADYFGIHDPQQIQFLIATVPDPLHSRLSLLTDSSIQAIEDAAQASVGSLRRSGCRGSTPQIRKKKIPRSAVRSARTSGYRRDSLGFWCFARAPGRAKRRSASSCF